MFMTLLRVSTFTIGGGYAMIPLMQAEFVDRCHWIEEKDIVDVFAVAQSMPGVIAVNSCILIGHKIAGTAGALVAAFGCVLPSFAVLSVVTRVYEAFITNSYVLGALRGISAAVVALMLSAVVKLSKQSVKGAIGMAIAACALGVSLIFPSLNAVYIIAASAAAGMLIKLPSLLGKKGGDQEK
jgi:chromate transporter